jgi:hypothetical protein
MGRFSLKKLIKVKGSISLKSQKWFAALGNLNNDVDINSAWETIRGNLKI